MYGGSSHWDFSNPYSNPCNDQWYGVTCSSENHVIKLDLYDSNLRGTIPSTIGHLSSLQYLNLSNNQLIGSIPSTIGNLSSVQLLNLNYNRLTGIVPSSLCLININVTFDLYFQGNMLQCYPECLNQSIHNVYPGSTPICDEPSSVQAFSLSPTVVPTHISSTPSTIKSSLSTITIVIGIFVVVFILISITLLILYIYNMRVKQLQEKRVYLHEIEEDQREEMESRTD